jgi:hypothetical protein
VVGCNDVKLSGKFLTKVFEGPYKEMKGWVREMKKYVKNQGNKSKNMNTYFTI